VSRYVVELYGLSSDISNLDKVEVELKDGASLGDIITALRRKIPMLVGPVIRPGEDRLVDYCMFNINGCFYFDDDSKLQTQSGDHIALLTVATGG